MINIVDIKNLDQDKENEQEGPRESEGDESTSLADLQKEIQEIVQKRFGGAVHVVGLDTHTTPSSKVKAETQEAPVKKHEYHFDLTPKQIVEKLNHSIIGQQEAKKALAIAVADHYRHIQAESQGDKSYHYQKQNVLLLGPTGVGKTFLVRSIAKMIGVPFVKADATRFTEVGYVGANVDDIIRDLVQQADGDISLAENGIVYVDEIDKIASSPNFVGKDVSGRGVQFGFLRLLEDAEIDLNSGQDMAAQFKNFMSLQKKGKVTKEVISTRNILFIFSGAFPELVNIIKKRTNNSSIGIHGENSSVSKEDSQDYLSRVKTEDLLQFGFEQEFVGRLPVVTSCHPLSEQDLLKILKDSDSSIIHQYIRNFAHYNVKLNFTDTGLQEMAQRAYLQKTGARALVKVCDQVLRDFKFELPSPYIKEILVTPEVVQNPQGWLQYMVAGHVSK